jgi:hypothetical protein
MNFEIEEREARDYLASTPREQWPGFLKNCRLLGLPAGENHPLNWRPGFEADMYWKLPADVVNQLFGYVKQLYA